MNKTAIAFSTKDRVELTRQSVEPLLQPDKFDLFWMDGSDTLDARQLALDNIAAYSIHHNVRGGADAAIVYGLTTLLNHPNQYAYIGLVENDVLLEPGWFNPTFALFARGKAEGLTVGAVSARAYEDRILLQRDGYAVMHNLGAGMVLFTREAARLVLDNFRTGWWPDNRLIFGQLSRLDIGRWGAFRDRRQNLTADWHFETTLASYGFASLALTPSPVKMIGQVPPLHEQGLKLVDRPVELLRNDKAFETFAECTRKIRASEWYPGSPACGGQGRLFADGVWTIFPHQLPRMGGVYTGPWRLNWSQGFGPFAWESQISEGTAHCRLEVPCAGTVMLLVSGGKSGGHVEVVDEASGETRVTELIPEGSSAHVMQIVVTGMAYRTIRLTLLEPGLRFYGIRSPDAQPWLPACGGFDHLVLPPIG